MLKELVHWKKYALTCKAFFKSCKWLHLSQRKHTREERERMWKEVREEERTNCTAIGIGTYNVLGNQHFIFMYRD